MSKIYNKFKNMAPMKYYEANASHPNAEKMIFNENNKFIAMRKYDGEWTRAIITEEGVLLQSRSISRVTGTYGDKTLLVPLVVNELSKLPVGTVLLGELAFNDYESTSREVGTITRCKPEKAIQRQSDKKLHFFVFDVLAYDGEILLDLPFEGRFAYYNDPKHSLYVKKAEYWTDVDSFMPFADEIWAKGGEGIMIVRKDMIYAPGKRTAWLSLKVKKKLGTLEAKIVDFIEPNKNYEGTQLDNWEYFVDKDNNPADILKGIDYGSLTPVTKPYFYGWKNGVVVEYEGRIIKVASGLTDQDRAWFATDRARHLLDSGQLYAKITGMELTSDSIRHPVFISTVIKEV